jgi:beta-glucosidase
VVDLSTPQSGGALFGNASPEIRGTTTLEAGRPVTIEIDHPYTEYPMLRGLMIGGEPVETTDTVALAVDAARASDVAIVVVGTDHEWETEGEDRTSMDLPGRQDELVSRVAAANPRTIVVINAGSPVTMPWLDEVAAVVQLWFPGEELGNVVADVLTGAAEPGGRLPVTFPRRLQDTPAYLSHPGADGLARYDEGLFIGYRWYDAREVEPLFPFGFGLGYTTWAFGPTNVSGDGHGATVIVPVTNTGTRRGSTVVQVYVQSPHNAPPDGPRRPVRELRGFAKVELDPGESFDVEVWLPRRAFAVWSVESHGWVVPRGRYEVLVGESSRSLVSAGAVSC